MLLDLLDPNNVGTYNITLAQVLGLNTAVYCSELLAIYKKALVKNKMVGDQQIYFKVDRKYIYKRTSLTIEQQLNIDGKLVEKRFLYKDPENPDVMYLNLTVLVSTIANENVEVISNLKEFFNESPSEIKRTRREKKVSSLQKSIDTPYPEVNAALRDWIAAIGSNPKNKLSDQAIKIFLDDVMEFANGNVELAVRIIKIATVQKYIMCKWAINIYEKDLRMQRENNLFTRERLNNNGSETATVNTLSEEFF